MRGHLRRNRAQRRQSGGIETSLRAARSGTSRRDGSIAARAETSVSPDHSCARARLVVRVRREGVLLRALEKSALRPRSNDRAIYPLGSGVHASACERIRAEMRARASNTAGSRSVTDRAWSVSRGMGVAEWLLKWTHVLAHTFGTSSSPCAAASCAIPACHRPRGSQRAARSLFLRAAPVQRTRS